MKQKAKNINEEKQYNSIRQTSVREMERVGMLTSMPQEGAEYEDYIQALIQSEPPYEKHYSSKRRKRLCRE